MSYRLLSQKTLSILLLLALVLSAVWQSSIVRADPDAPLPFLDDFQGGIPSGFVAFADSWDGSGSSTTIGLATATSDLPTVAHMDGTTVASVTYHIANSGSWGGGPGYAGISRDFTSTKDLSHYDALRFWYKGSNTGGTTQVELKTAGPNAGSSNRFVYAFPDNSSDWRYFVLPFADFVKRTDYNPGAALGDDPALDLVWGYSILLPVTDGSFSMDEVSVTGYSAIVDFESGPPTGFVGFADSWDGSGSSTTLALNYATTANLPTIPAQDGTKVVKVDYNVAASGSWGGGPGYAGITHDFTSAQNWFNFQGLSFWYKGGGTGAAMRVELKSDGANAGASNRFVYGFSDDFSNWRYVTIPWASFVKRTDYNPGAGLGDSIVHSAIWGYSILIPGGASGTFHMDNVAAYGGGGGVLVPHAKFSAPTYNVDEDAGTATITVNLDAATTVPVSVDYATSNGSASAGTDYTAASGTLNFAAGETSKTFAVAITDNLDLNAARSINLSLSNPSAATLGSPNTAVLTIIDNETGALPFLDDFQGGIPSGFVAFADSWDGSGSSTTISLGTATSNLSSVPPMDGTTVASATYHIATSGSWGGGPGYAGVSRDFPATVDLSGYKALRFWYKGSNTGGTTQVELKTDGASAGGSNRFVYAFVDNSSDWRYFSIPFTSFVKRTDYNPGAALGDNPALEVAWGYSILLPVTDGSFSIDEVSVTGYGTTFDFESGIPSGLGVFNGGGSSVSLGTTADSSVPNVPAQAANDVAAVTYNITDYGGITHPFAASADWSPYQGLSFWYKGDGTSKTIGVELKTMGPNAGASDLFQYNFTDNSSGWRFVSIPWSSFFKRTDYNPGAALGDNIDTSVIWGYSILAPSGSGSFWMDNVAPYGGGGGTVVPKVKFSSATYGISESGGSATITVDLSIATTVATSVDYATSNGSAVAGTDYTAASGTLNFAAGETSKSFMVAVADNAVYNTPTTVNLTLSNPSAADLGIPSTAVLSILDDDPAPDSKIVDDYEDGADIRYNAFGTGINFATWGSESNNTTLSTVSVGAGDPLAVPGQSGSKSLLKIDYNIGAWGGFTHALADDNDWVSQDWSRYDGISFWAYGNNTGTTIQTEIFDNQQLGNAGDSAERWYYRFDDNYSGWKNFRIPFSAFQRRTDFQPGGAPNDGLNLTQVSGYAFGFGAGTGAKTAYLSDYSLYGDLSSHPLVLRVESAAYAYGANEGSIINAKVWLNDVSGSTVTVDYAFTGLTAAADTNYDDSNASGTLTFDPGETSQVVAIQTLNDGKVKPTLTMTLTLSNASGASLGWKSWARLGVINTNTVDPSIIDDFENKLPVPARLFSTPLDSISLSRDEILSSSPDAVPGQFSSNFVLSGADASGSSLTRLLDTSRDLSAYNGLRFWYKGSNTGDNVTVKLFDGQPEAGASDWSLAWSDEFSGPAGTAPNTTNWNRDIGGHGWGNNEWEYYTNSTDNAALDGSGHLVISAKPNSDSSLECTYGPSASSPQTCAYTSARLLTKDRFDFAYGRAEASLQIPYGQGIWPAFWMLGSDIETNPWPGSGEIDIMENIGKASEQQRLYGTIHGPGYSGGSGVGSGPYETGVTLHDAYHTYAVEWEPSQIRWYFDGTQYFSADPSDIPAGQQWVFNKPFFLIMNIAVGGGWPGNPDGTTTFPQNMNVDYVRVYQSPDVAQRFEASFTDDTAGWKLVTIPFSDFVPSASQPAGAASNAHPLLTHTRGYGFEFPGDAGSFKLDDVRGVNGIFPTATPVNTATATPTVTNTPTKTSTSTITPTASKTSKPTKTPEPTKTVKPTKTPEPTKTPKPTSTPKPSWPWWHWWGWNGN